MAFLSLRTASFRNIKDAGIDTRAKDIFLIGENGQGKTNFLEALYFCSYASSFRGVKDGDLARYGTGAFSASAELGPLLPEKTLGTRIVITVENSCKTVRVNGKKVEDRKDLLKISPCVAFCHEDMEFVSGGQERRRWFFDQTQSLYDPVYVDDLRRYRRILKTRNTVLREGKFGADYRRVENLLDALDPQLAEYGVRLMEQRKRRAHSFSSLLNPLYEEVSGIKGVGVTYTSSWKNDINVLSYLEERRTADLAQGLTLSGPHRDRYFFTRDREDFSAAASTGQRRLLALLLRTAQARGFFEARGTLPVLLLDDVLLELDGEKRRRFLSLMPGYEQAFFAFLPEEPYKKYGKSDTLIYYVSNGAIGGS
ncbi:MAG: DNA replication and repair protein RecF [Spirochaetaceae bacterium]|jgi:DNA replication and repair protein RecF|nr:DNA replication and repair protein RecF [Spirochaetaceae bacterium]